MASSYVTLAGPSEWAIVNSLWAATEHYEVRPDQVFIIHESSVRPIALKASSLIESLLVGYDIEPTVKTVELRKEDYVSIGTKVGKIVREGKKDGEVSVDITPGRKRYAFAALIAAVKENADHIFYLYLENLWNANRPYPMIPYILHQIDDLKEVQSRGRS